MTSQHRLEPVDSSNPVTPCGPPPDFVVSELSNALKHSRGNTVFINLRRNSQEVELEVADNGCGFDLEHKRVGMGLQNMLDRAEKLGGWLMIDSKPGQGTRVCLKVKQRDTLDAVSFEKTGDGSLDCDKDKIFVAKY